MSRNKYPEITVENILEVSQRLFFEKGYDNTKIQDIADELGMTKGAIYHHFKSKEEIMNNLKDTIEGKDSVVILMHDAPNKDLTAETLKSVIKYLKDEGYSFKNIYDII